MVDEIAVFTAKTVFLDKEVGVACVCVFPQLNMHLRFRATVTLWF